MQSNLLTQARLSQSTWQRIAINYIHEQRMARNGFWEGKWFHACQSWSACVGNYEQLSGTNPITGHKRHACLPLVLGACSLVVWWGRKGIDQILNVVKGTNRDREKAVGNRCKVILSAVSRFLRQTDRLGKWPDFSFFFIPSQKQRDKDCPCKEFGKCLQTIYLVKFLFWGFFSLKK